MQRYIELVLLTILFSLCGCKDDHNSLQSPVPRYPVNIIIDTRSGVFVHFKPTALNTYVLVDQEGYHYNGEIVQRSVLDAIGYGGVVVYIDIEGNYNAWDLACPYCAARGKRSPCAIDGIFAICPACGEKYDLGSGTAAPQKGIASDCLLNIPINNYDGKLTIRQ